MEREDAKMELPTDDSNEMELPTDDSNQYEEYYIEEELLHPGKSFPVSERSKESSAFNDYFPKILAYLRTKQIEWESVECVGRLSSEKKIQTTVLTGFSKLPDSESRNAIEQGLKSVMTRLPLPIEFVEGGFIEESHFGFMERQNPLVCGISCGSKDMGGSGSIGGFVTIKGDPDPEAIYAVTCHHVISGDEKGIPWARHDDLAEHLGIDVRIQRDLGDLLGEQLNANSVNRSFLGRIMDLLNQYEHVFEYGYYNPPHCYKDD